MDVEGSASAQGGGAGRSTQRGARRHEQPTVVMVTMEYQKACGMETMGVGS